jgi:transposase
MGMPKETIELSLKERDRLRVVHEVEQGYITASEAARAIGISYRQFRRILARWRAEGDKGLAHRLRGRPSNRRTPKASQTEALRLIAEKYPDFGPTLVSEKLASHGIALSRETVRKLMIDAGHWSERKRKERHRRRRERRRCFGELVQVDGSHHDWLEGRGKRMVLIAMIDDATSRVIARFYPGESMEGLMGTLRIWLETHGRPRAIYADRHSLWVSQAGVPGEREAGDSTQLRRALRQLGIDFIPAGSPQAKGRVERLFGTLQDRLVKEMRLKHIDNIDDANRFLVDEYLPWHNGTYTVDPACRADAHGKLGRGLDVDLILSRQEERTVANDYTVRWHNRLFQIEPPAYPGLRGGRVAVAELFDGSVEILYRERKLGWREIESSTYKSTRRHTAPRGSMGGEPPAKPKTPWIPPPDHPWRRFVINPK